MAQLKRGGKQTLESILNHLAYIDHHALDNPAAVRKLTQKIREQLEEEVKPYLMRAEPTIEKQLAELRQMVETQAGRIDALEGRKVIALRKAE